MEIIDNKFYLNSSKATYISSVVRDATKKFGTAFYKHIKSLDMEYSDLILLCIGTDRATGDSLGPLTGHKLMELPELTERAKIYGTLSRPVHAVNLESTLRHIYGKYDNPLIVAIDACLGESAHIGYITIRTGSVTPGAGINRSLPKVGDLAITGIVNYSGMIDFLILQNTRLNLVMRMADVISSGIYSGLEMMNDVEAAVSSVN